MPLQIQNIHTTQPALSVPQAQDGPLAQYQPGDTLTAVVTSTDGKTAALQLPDGTQIEAAMQAGQQLEAQDALTLQLNQLAGRAATLRLVAVNGQPVTAEVPVLDFKLMQMDVAPTQANRTAAALLSQLEIPVTPQAIAQFESITRSYPLLPVEQAALLAASDIPATPQNVAAFIQFLQSPVQAEEFAAALRALTQPAGQSPDAAQTGGAAQPGAFSAQLTDVLAQLSPKLAAFFSANADAQAAPAAPQNAAVQPNAQNAAAAQPAPAQADVSGQAAFAPLTGMPADARAVQDALQAIFPKLLPQESEALGKALQRAVPALSSRVAALTDAAAGSASPAAKQVTQLGNQFCQQLQFGNELGTLYYTQIPFSRQDQQSNAELYVLKRNGGKRIDQDNATIALCLQTRSMGLVETLLQVKDRSLSFRFRVESAQVREFFQSNLDALRARPFPVQYHVKDMNVTLLESPLTPVNATREMLDAFGQTPNSAGVDISL
ncbi:MAG: hypothetical protein Q4E65_05110 [Clostridia bacterium]|nr:hypothetical protein [Clostridia bacterium]